MKKITYDPIKHASFDKEWGIHKKCREWWYATGIVFDDDGYMYSYQYTLLHLAFGFLIPKVAMVALTDYKENRHYYLQTLAGKNNKVVIDENEASVINVASAKKVFDGISIDLKHKHFKLNLKCNYGKGSVWHCEEGKLQMGIADKNATTIYYSWTNMPTEGTLMLNGKSIHVKGKTWFDKQGGTYNMANMKCHWEWFSLRFFDDEEIMLFTFPHNEIPQFDGTYIRHDGSYIRLYDYKIESLNTTEYKGLMWSSGWKLYVPVKEEEYLIEPIQEGHMNFAYFEELCSIKNKNGDNVGYAFAELLPGVLNKERLSKGSSNISMKDLFTRIEF